MSGQFCLNAHYLEQDETRWSATGCGEDGALIFHSPGHAPAGSYASIVALLGTLPAADKEIKSCPSAAGLAHVFARDENGVEERWHQCAMGTPGVSNPDDLNEPYRSIAKLLLGPP